MSEFTPTTEEVRTDYIMAYTERQSSQLLAGLAFDRWHAAEVRRAKAEALREMADELEPGAVHQSPYVKAGVDIIRCILNRADQIEKETTNDHP